MDTVADVSAKVIRDRINSGRCPSRLEDELRFPVPTENLLIYARLSGHVLVFMNHRSF